MHVACLCIALRYIHTCHEDGEPGSPSVHIRLFRHSQSGPSNPFSCVVCLTMVLLALDCFCPLCQAGQKVQCRITMRPG